MTKNALFTGFISICLVSTFSFAQGRKVPLENLNFTLLSPGAEKFGLLILDNRPQVADKKSQPESFMGYIRSITGIAWPYFTKSDEALGNILLKKIADAYQSSGASVNPLGASAFYTSTELEKRMAESGCDKIILFDLKNFYFDGVAKIEYVVDVELSIVTIQNQVLFHKKFVSKHDIPGSSQKFKTTVPAMLKKILEEIFNHQEVISAAKSSQVPTTSEPSKSGSFDIIFTKTGEEIQATVIEITTDTVKYKLASQPEGPVRNIKLTDLFMIKYKNGDKEVFQK